MFNNAICKQTTKFNNKKGNQQTKTFLLPTLQDQILKKHTFLAVQTCLVPPLMNQLHALLFIFNPSWFLRAKNFCLNYPSHIYVIIYVSITPFIA